MNITRKDIAHIRAVAVTAGEAYDVGISSEIVIALCDRVEQLDKEAEWLAKRLHEADERVAVRWWRKAAREAVEKK